MYILFQIIFPCTLLQNIEYSCLCSRSLLVNYFIYYSMYGYECVSVCVKETKLYKTTFISQKCIVCMLPKPIFVCVCMCMCVYALYI